MVIFINFMHYWNFFIQWIYDHIIKKEYIMKKYRYLKYLIFVNYLSKNVLKWIQSTKILSCEVLLKKTKIIVLVNNWKLWNRLILKILHWKLP